jgi:hypothetical protein
VLDAPIPTPGMMSPSSPYLFGRTPNLANSNGFEAMALSKDGDTLYPILEGPLVGADPLDRVVFEFDVSERRFTGRRWTYRMTQPDTFASDAVALDRDTLVVLERDNLQGNPFRFPYQTVEAILPVDKDEFAVVNDTNFGSTGRKRSLPDYSDFILVKAR